MEVWGQSRQKPETHAEYSTEHSHRSSQIAYCLSSVGSLFHARGTPTEKATSLILRLVRGTTKSPLTDARSEDRGGMLATGVNRSAM